MEGGFLFSSILPPQRFVRHKCSEKKHDYGESHKRRRRRRELVHLFFFFPSVYFGVYLFFILPISIAHVKSHFFVVVTLLVQPVCLCVF